MIKKESIIWFTLAVLFMNIYFIADYFNEKLIISIALIVFSVSLYTVIFPKAVYKNIKTVFTISFLFYIFYYLIYFHRYFLYLFGILDHSYDVDCLHSKCYYEQQNKAIIMSLVGLLSYNLGYSLIKARAQKKESIQHFSYYNKTLPILMFSLGLLLIAIFYNSSAWDLLVLNTYSGSNMKISGLDGLYRLLLFVSIWCVSVFIYMQSIGKSIFIKYIALFPALLWASLLLYIGDRNQAVYILLSILAGYYTFIKKSNIKQIIIYAFLGLFLYQLIGILRYIEVASVSEAIAAYREEKSNSPSYFGADLFSTTTMQVRAAIYYVPEHWSYMYGSALAYSIIGVFPFLGGLTSDYLKSLFGNELAGSSTLLNHALLGPNATWGVGSNVITDGFVQFGMFGVFAFLTLVGLLARKIELTIKQKKLTLLNLSLYLMILVLVFELPRYTFTSLLKPIAWTFIFFYIVEMVFLKRK